MEKEKAGKEKDKSLEGDAKKEKPKELNEDEPKDNLQFVEIERAKGSAEGLGKLFEYNFIVTMEPQSIRSFSI